MNFQKFTYDLSQASALETAQTIVRKHGTQLKAILGSSREDHVRRARAEVMLFLKESKGWSYPSIAKLFQRPDHAAILRSVRRIRREKAKTNA